MSQENVEIADRRATRPSKTSSRSTRNSWTTATSRESEPCSPRPLFTGGSGTVSGRDAIEKLLRDNVIVYEDGTPRTKHITTNLAVEV